MRVLLRVSLRVVGYAAIAFGTLVSAVAYARPGDHPLVILISLLTLAGLPVAGGLLALTAADRLRTATRMRPHTSFWVWSALAISLVPAAFSLRLMYQQTSTRTQVIVALVTLIAAVGHHYAQVYRPWRSQAVQRFTESVVGEILFQALRGFFYLVVQVLVMAISGGRAPFAFSGGSSGGGGARGRW